MSNQIFIPDKIKVGFQNREGTYTGKLAYVIYYDNKGVLRKEKSWQSWRDEKIDPVDFENKPFKGFILNKNIERYNWSSFGSGRSYIRVYDPRGIEFEITPENLIGILMESDCFKRCLDGEFVYAWKGTELLLLPCSSEDYLEAKQYTKRQSLSISARNLKEGCSYITKQGEEVIYIGRFMWYERNYWYYSNENINKTAKKSHIFYDGKGFMRKGDTKFLAQLNSPDPVLNYAELVEKFDATPNAHAVVDVTIKPQRIKLDEFRHQTWAKKINNKVLIYDVDSGWGRKNYYIRNTYEIDLDTLKASHFSGESRSIRPEDLPKFIADKGKPYYKYDNGMEIEANI